MSKFQIGPVKTGYIFQLKAANGEMIAPSQVYASLKSCEDKTAKNIISKKHPKFELYLDENHTYQAKASCQKGIASVRKNAPIAEVLIMSDLK